MFFRQGTTPGKRSTTRSGGTSEAQLKELRGRARRRLIGALALVLAAFVVVPWLFDEPVTDDAQAPIVVPAAPSGLPGSGPTLAAQSGGASGQVSPDTSTAPAQPDTTSTPAASGSSTSLAQASGSAPPPDDTSGAAQAGGSQADTTPAPAPAPEPSAAVPAPEPAPKPAKPEPKPKSVERTDDGSVALALLSGKTPVKPSSKTPVPASGQGSYYLQVAAYTAQQDALQRRDSLRQSGVTDAYVEQGQSGGRTVYRLRVGPFSSHEAAQAAQTRLRALGYQNGLISDK